MSGRIVHPIERKRFAAKILGLDYGLILLLSLIAGIGVVMLYSAAQGPVEQGGWDPWADRHLARYGFALLLAVVIAVIDIRIWMALAYPIYAVAVVLLIMVELFGVTAMGAQRWLDIGPMQIQPSEIMKTSIVLVLARYYHMQSADQSRRVVSHIPAAVMIIVPVALIMHQPDLGTAMLVLLMGAAVMFLAGIDWRVVAGAIAAFVVMVPLSFFFILHDYQRQRIMTFLDPSSDPMGAGYHIMQSKIAMGSAGLFGKGFLHGSQSQLNFLPEKHTDFIFPTFAEEFGFLGAMGLLVLYLAVITRCLTIAAQSRSQFARLTAAGLTAGFTIYVLINTAMVMGLAPVVGVPLPLVSYGGTSMISVMVGFGLVLCAHIHKHAELPRTHNAWALG